MKVGLRYYKLVLLVCCSFITLSIKAQFLVDMIDTTKSQEKGLWAVFRKSDHLQISGYFQPQFQVAQSKGVKNYSGGDFSANANNRFILRRGRIRFDYAHFNDQGLPQAQVVFQFDGSDRGVVIRDFWARYYENRFQLFSFTTGMFARPFGYELNLSSGDRETPERGRMSQTLMRTERDIGAMATFEPRKKSNPVRFIKLDVGAFNGQGLTGNEEYDSYKDFIGKLALKPYPLSKNVTVSGAVSMFQGGILQNSNVVYRMGNSNGSKVFIVDSSATNLGSKAPRRYRSLDMQLKFRNSWGKTEIRGEYWWGTQTASADESTTPGSPLKQPHYIREFNGAFVYFLQNLFSEKHLAVVKFDFFDPNTNIGGSKITALANAHAGDIRYNTLGIGYIYFLDTHLKLMLWYDIVKNETTALDGFTSDIRDNIFTMRAQFRF